MFGVRQLVASSLVVVALSGRAAAQCEVDPNRGYGVWVQPAGGLSPDTVFLAAAARLFAYRWAVPSAKREMNVGWQRVRERLLPPEPRWADDWFPGEEDRAEATMVIYKDGMVRAALLKSTSSDTLFASSLATIADAPMVSAPAVPAIPPELKSDSVMLKVTFSFDDPMGARGVQHFAALQTPVQFEPPPLAAGAGRGGSRTNRPSGATEGTTRLTIKYDVLATGEVKSGSIEVIESSESAVATRVREMLSRARLKPATSICKDIAITVVQFITF